MSVYKVLVQKFYNDKEIPFQTERIEICAARFRVTDEGTLLFLSDTTPSQYVAAYACGTWYRVETVEGYKCECGCDGKEAVEKALPLPVQVW